MNDDGAVILAKQPIADLAILPPPPIEAETKLW
jgi:hypothetical protein